MQCIRLNEEDNRRRAEPPDAILHSRRTGYNILCICQQFDDLNIRVLLLSFHSTIPTTTQQNIRPSFWLVVVVVVVAKVNKSVNTFETLKCILACERPNVERLRRPRRERTIWLDFQFPSCLCLENEGISAIRKDDNKKIENMLRKYRSILSFFQEYQDCDTNIERDKLVRSGRAAKPHAVPFNHFIFLFPPFYFWIFRIWLQNLYNRQRTWKENSWK